MSREDQVAIILNEAGNDAAKRIAEIFPEGGVGIFLLACLPTFKMITAQNWPKTTDSIEVLTAYIDQRTTEEGASRSILHHPIRRS